METIYLKPFEWRGDDERDGYFINIIGHDEENDTRMFRIRYQPWFYIGIPENDETKVLEVMNYLQENVKGIMNYEIEEKKGMWGYRANTRKVIRISFNKLVTLYTCRKFLRKAINGTKYECYESDVSQITKYQTERDLIYSDWIMTNKYKEVYGSARKSLCVKEYWVSATTVNRVTDLELKKKLGVPLPSVLSFDLEVNATNRKAMPKSHEPDDVVFCCSFTFKSKKKYEQHSIVLENCKPKSNCQLHIVKDEKEMADKFCDLVLELDPDIILGHNIFKFDLPYWDARLARGNFMWNSLSRYANYESKMKNISWESSAYNEIDFSYLDCPGRLFLDTLSFFHRGYKLPNYKLETIAQQFLGVGKNPVTPQDIFELYSHHDPDDLGKIVDYCVKDTELPLQLFEKVKMWFELVETSNVVRVAIFDLYTRGQGIRVFSQEYYELHRENYLITSRKAEKHKYEGGFVFDGIPGLYDDVFCFDFASLYPSIMISHNFCYTTLVDDNDPISDDKCHIIEWNDSKTGHHYRFRWIKQEYHQGILSRLLQKLATERKRIRAEMAPLEEKIKNGTISPEELIRFYVLDAQQKSIKVSMNSVYGDKGSTMSKLPLLEAAMCTTAVGRDSVQQTAKSLEVKYKAKTVYGDTDSCMEQIPGFQKYRKHAKEIGEKLASEASTMFLAPMKLEFEKAFTRFFFIGKKMYAGFLMDLKNPEIPVDQLSEQQLDKLFFCRGIPIARRDNCKFLRVLYKKTLYMIMLRRSREEVLSYVESQIRRLLSRQVPFDDLVVIKKMGKDYKSASNPLAIFNQYLKSRGEIVEPGDRLEYVFVELENDQPSLQGDKMQSPKFFLLDENSIDVRYYLTNVVATPINKILHLAYPTIPKDYILKSLLPFFDSRRSFLDSIRSRPLSS